MSITTTLRMILEVMGTRLLCAIQRVSEADPDAAHEAGAWNTAITYVRHALPETEAGMTRADCEKTLTDLAKQFDVLIANRLGMSRDHGLSLAPVLVYEQAEHMVTDALTPYQDSHEHPSEQDASTQGEEEDRFRLAKLRAGLDYAFHIAGAQTLNECEDAYTTVARMEMLRQLTETIDEYRNRDEPDCYTVPLNIIDGYMQALTDAKHALEA
ncbi:hypothetical protein [Bifidobacterium canis]|uniref:Uncharacterized protein n=1 Tax=Bifidobacterium canis TaxID=2610880 RepID=A0A7K1J478_9BIFI|nr:hypothetical protein [Bifidobacterium canis]MUH59444.1 hypothetical protein [Bifidobacterium canis]